MKDSILEQRLRRVRWLQLAAVLLIVLVTGVLLLTIDNLLVSFVIAFVINYLLTPVVNFLERRGVPRQAAIMIPFLGTGLLIGISIYLLLPLISEQVSTLEAHLPRYQTELLALLGRMEMRFKSFFNLYGINMTQAINTWIISKTAEFSSLIPSVVSHSLTVSLLSPFLGFFMLQDGRRIARELLSLVPNSLFELALNLQHQINDQMGGFIRARFLEAAIVGLVVWAGLALVGFPYAPLLAFFAAITNLIPYIGPLIGAIPAVLIALISKEGTLYEPMSVNLIVVTSVYFIAQLIDVVFIIPFVVARIVNLHPVTVILVIIIGAQMMGILGMVISIPVACVLKLTINAIYSHLLNFRV